MLYPCLVREREESLLAADVAFREAWPPFSVTLKFMWKAHVGLSLI